MSVMESLEEARRRMRHQSRDQRFSSEVRATYIECLGYVAQALARLEGTQAADPGYLRMLTYRARRVEKSRAKPDERTAVVRELRQLLVLWAGEPETCHTEGGG